MPTLTHTQHAAMKLAKDDAATAEMALRRRAGDGPKARPSLADINSTLDRLVSIQRLLAIALEPNTETREEIVKRLGAKTVSEAIPLVKF